MHVGGRGAVIRLEGGPKLGRGRAGVARREACAPTRQIFFDRLMFLVFGARLPRSFEFPPAVVGVSSPNQGLAECIAGVPVFRITGQRFAALLEGGCPILPGDKNLSQLPSSFE